MRFAFAAVLVHVGCVGTLCGRVENKGLLDLQLREFRGDFFGSREAQQVLSDQPEGGPDLSWLTNSNVPPGASVFDMLASMFARCEGNI